MHDLLVIGGGPAGYLAAERAGQSGLKTVLFEKNALGGVCLNEGCIPSKTLLHSAKIFDYSKTGKKYGVTFEGARLDQEAVMKRKTKVVRILVAGVKAALNKHGVDLVEGEAHILPRSGEGFSVECNGTTYAGKRILIATGSVPILPPIEGLHKGLETGFVLTNREILNLQQVPGQLVVVGGGVVGLEMASYYNSAGSHVHVVEMLNRIAYPTDRDMADLLRKEYEKKGVVFHLESRLTAVTEKSVIFEQQGNIQEIHADKVLVSIGRKPFTQGLGLENLGVEINRRGAIPTDDRGRTNIADVYAAGDVNGVSMLAHTAYREAEVCIHTMLGHKDTMRYHAVPSVIYTNPEVASVGETEETAREKGMDFECTTLSMRYSGRYVAENEDGTGICKVLVDKRRRNVIGVSMIGNYASELIYGASLMIETEMTVEDLRELVFPHPTVCEIIREALFVL